ncbi:MAG: zinc-binding dehydrogenase, partial [Chloroflexota bacterium]|nr:zinc-binding dehydrogenase [Chloroflexota bacterium]
VETRSDRFREGDRVIVLPTSDTTLVEYIEALPERMIALPDDGPMNEWLMCQPSGTVIYGCQQLGMLLGKNVVVLGQGAIGLSFTAILSRSGVSNLIAVDPLDYRLEYSEKFGATHIVNPTVTPTEDAVLDILGGEKPDIVVEAAGYTDTLNMALRLVKSFGTVMMFGIQQKSREHGFVVPMEYADFRGSNARLKTVAAGHTEDITSHIELMVELKRRGWWDPAELITHRLPFDEVQRAFDMYVDHDDGIVKVVMER